MSTLGTTSAAPLYAGFWRRVAASSFDGAYLAVPSMIIGMVIPDRVPRLLLGIIVYCAYYAGFHSSSSQATPGKKFFGIKVTDHEGGRIGLGRAIGRYFAVVLSFIVLCLGFVPAAFTQKRQALHDLICSTLVVDRNAQPAEIVAGGGVMPVTAGVFAVASIAFAVPLLALILIFVAIPVYQDYAVRTKAAEIDASRTSKGEVERTENRAWTTADGDVTKIGILANADFRGDKAIILGLSLGQTWDEARKVIQANPELTIREDTLNKGRFYVYDRGGPAEGDRAVFYCQWPDGTAKMGRLVIYPRIARFLPAGDTRLFVARSAASLPPEVKSWLGPEDRAVVTLDVSSMKTTTHVYEKRALEVSDDIAIFHAPIVHVSFVRPDLLARHK